MQEFTGERVIPGEVDQDLLNEHLARYAFAARLARGKRVLDAGCGVGYGAAQLATTARRVVGLDRAGEAVALAQARYSAPRVAFLRGDCSALPFPAASFDLVVAFEVIEHLEHWERLIEEARRVLAPAGEFIVSTPNRLYYGESRGTPNPFHVHEFDHEEFADALRRHFPEVRILLENHSEGVFFSLPEATAMETFVESGSASPGESHFFVAVCSARPILSLPPFVYIPQSGNVLRERERHIALLQGELAQKDQWLAETTGKLDDLNRAHQALQQEAAEDRRRAQEAIDALEQENRRKTDWGQQQEAEIERLKGIIDQTTAWAQKLDAERSELLDGYQRLDQEAGQLRADLGASVEQLHSTEAELDSRTGWAQELDRQNERYTADLNAIFGSLGYRIGKRLGLIPRTLSDPKERQGALGR